MKPCWSLIPWRIYMFIPNQICWPRCQSALSQIKEFMQICLEPWSRLEETIIHFVYDRSLHKIRRTGCYAKQGIRDCCRRHFFSLDLLFWHSSRGHHGPRQGVLQQAHGRAVPTDGNEAWPTSAYHPQFNAQAEVANKTIAKFLRNQVDTSTLNWVIFLPPLMFSYNTSFHRTIHTSPFFLTFGQNAVQPDFNQDK